MSNLSNLLFVRPRASHELSNGVWYGSIGRRGAWQQLGARWAIYQVFTTEPYSAPYDSLGTCLETPLNGRQIT